MKREKPNDEILEKVIEIFGKDKKNYAKIFFNLSKSKLEKFNQLISQIHKIKYRRKKRERLLGNQSKALPYSYFLELLKFFDSNKRVQLAILIQGFQGLAECDVIRLKIDNFNFQSHYMRYTRKKTGVCINIPIHHVVEYELQRYIVENLDEIKKHNNYIFYSNAVVRLKEHISERYLRQEVSSALQKKGYWITYAQSSDGRDLHKYTNHSLRGCAATLIWNQNHNIKEVQQLLGHSPKSVETTFLYIQDEETNLWKYMRR